MGRGTRYNLELLTRFAFLAAPVAVVYGSTALMQLIDAWIVGGLGTVPLAAITPATFLYLVPLGLGLGTLVGVNTLCAQSVGSGRSREVSRYAWSGMLLALSFGALFFLLYPLSPFLFALFPGSPEVQAMEVNYFRVCLGALTPNLLAAALANFFIGTHRSLQPLFCSLIAVVVNAWLSYNLVHGGSGLPALGLQGAAWGTVGASWLQVLLLLGFFLRRSERSRYATGSTHPQLIHAKRILRLGFPIGLQEAGEILSWGIVMSWLIGHFGTTHLAAGTILLRLMQVSFLPSVGAGVAVTSLTAWSIGRGRPDRARAYTRLGAIITIGYMTVFGVLCCVFRDSLLRCFTDDPEVYRIAMQIILVMGAMQTFDAMAIIYGDALRGVGDTLWPAVVNITLCGLLLLVGGLVAIHLFPEVGSLGVWIVDFLYVAALGILYSLRWYSGAWEERGRQPISGVKP